MLVAEGSSAMTLVSDDLCLSGHEVGHHVGGGSAGGDVDVAQFDMFAAEVDTHVDVA